MWAVRVALVIALCATASAARAADGAAMADAVQRRDGAAVQRLLRDRIDVNAAQADGATALHWAAHWGDAETAARLIAAGAKAGVVNEHGVSPLHLACASGNVAVVTLLLKNGAPTEVHQQSGETPLIVAARTGRIGIVRALAEAGAQLNGADAVRGQTALMWAANEHHADVVRLLVEHGADRNQRSRGGFTALMFAGRVGDPVVTQVLLDAGARLEDSAAIGGTALLLAAEGEAAIVSKDFKRTVYASGHEETAILLVERGANPNATDEFGHTALHLAVRKAKHRLIKALLAHRADLNARMTRDELPLPGDFNARDGLAGATPFFLAAAASDLEAMRLLAEAGADPKMPGVLGLTPLMAAVGAHQYESRLPPQGRQIEAITFCLSLGNDINAADTTGQTAVHYAVQMGVDEVLAFLIEHGAKPDAKDRRGRTPLDVAVSNPSRPRPQSAALLRRYLNAMPAPVR
jgi:ankyrin repeat protein